jgi:hypothetical protein
MPGDFQQKRFDRRKRGCSLPLGGKDIVKVDQLLPPGWTKEMAGGYLLPPGCKNLIASLKVEIPEHFQKTQPVIWNLLLPVKGEAMIHAPFTVKKLAVLLGEKPLVICADLIQLGIYATPDDDLSLKTTEQLFRKHGFTIKYASS